MRGGLRVIRTDRGSAERLEKKFLRSAPLLRTGYTCGGILNAGGASFRRCGYPHQACLLMAAEKVETQEHLKKTRALNIGLAQGYLLEKKLFVV